MGEGGAHLSGIENANDARDNRAVLTFVFLADELDVSKFAEVEIALFLQPVHCQLQIQQLLGEKVVLEPEVLASGSLPALTALWWPGDLSDPCTPPPPHLLVQFKDLGISLMATISG